MVIRFQHVPTITVTKRHNHSFNKSLLYAENSENYLFYQNVKAIVLSLSYLRGTYVKPLCVGKDLDL